MPDYINRNELLEDIEYYISHTNDEDAEHYAYKTCKRVIGNMPAADVVKVVRCDDCIFSRELRTDIEKETYCEGVVMCANGVWGTELAVWGDNFCSYGERKDENET